MISLVMDVPSRYNLAPTQFDYRSLLLQYDVSSSLTRSWYNDVPFIKADKKMCLRNTDWIRRLLKQSNLYQFPFLVRWDVNLNISNVDYEKRKWGGSFRTFTQSWHPRLQTEDNARL